MFTGQTHLSKGNFPFNLKNNTEITITIFNLTSRTGFFFQLSSLVFLFFVSQAGRSKRNTRQSRINFFHAPHHVRFYFDPRSARARLKNKRRKDLSVLYAIFKKVLLRQFSLLRKSSLEAIKVLQVTQYFQIGFSKTTASPVKKCEETQISFIRDLSHN